MDDDNRKPNAPLALEYSKPMAYPRPPLLRAAGIIFMSWIFIMLGMFFVWVAFQAGDLFPIAGLGLGFLTVGGIQLKRIIGDLCGPRPDVAQEKIRRTITQYLDNGR